MPSKTEQVPAAWLITGCSTGIGRHIALAALAKGHKVAVTARNVAAVEDIVAEHPEKFLNHLEPAVFRPNLHGLYRIPHRPHFRKVITS